MQPQLKSKAPKVIPSTTSSSAIQKVEVKRVERPQEKRAERKSANVVTHVPSALNRADSLRLSSQPPPPRTTSNSFPSERRNEVNVAHPSSFANVMKKPQEKEPHEVIFAKLLETMLKNKNCFN